VAGGFANVETRQLCVQGSHNRFMASTELSAALAVPRVELVLARPDVAECARTEPGYRLSLLRWLAAVASDDGAVSLTEYEQLCMLALEGGSALEMHTVLRAIEQPQAPEEALAGLRGARTTARRCSASWKSSQRRSPSPRLQRRAHRTRREGGDAKWHEVGHGEDIETVDVMLPAGFETVDMQNVRA